MSEGKAKYLSLLRSPSIYEQQFSKTPIRTNDTLTYSRSTITACVADRMGGPLAAQPYTKALSQPRHQDGG